MVQPDQPSVQVEWTDISSPSVIPDEPLERSRQESIQLPVGEELGVSSVYCTLCVHTLTCHLLAKALLADSVLCCRVPCPQAVPSMAA